MNVNPTTDPFFYKSMDSSEWKLVMENSEIIVYSKYRTTFPKLMKYTSMLLKILSLPMLVLLKVAKQKAK